MFLAKRSTLFFRSCYFHKNSVFTQKYIPIKTKLNSEIKSTPKYSYVVVSAAEFYYERVNVLRLLPRIIPDAMAAGHRRISLRGPPGDSGIDVREDSDGISEKDQGGVQ